MGKEEGGGGRGSEVRDNQLKCPDLGNRKIEGKKRD